jgi:hypothetical protein
MPVTQQQPEANRIGAQLFSALKSLEEGRGKVVDASRGANPENNARKKSGMNALRHGVTAQTTIRTEEDRIRHDAFCAALTADLAPVGPLETFLASSVAEEAWRLNHARSQCENIEALGHFDGTGDVYDAEHPEIHTAVTAACTTRDNAKTLQLLSLYAQRIHRAYQKYFDQLRTLQAERKAKHEADLEQARLFFQMAELHDLPFNPADDGFVFSNREIALYTDRYYRRIQAREADYTYGERRPDSNGRQKAEALPKAA